MKNTIKNYSYTLIFIILATFIFSLLLTILKQNDLISLNSSNVIENIISLSLFFIGAFILGLKQKRKGLINGLVLVILSTLITIILSNPFSSLSSIIKWIGKAFLIIFGSIIGVNLKK